MLTSLSNENDNPTTTTTITGYHLNLKELDAAWAVRKGMGNGPLDIHTVEGGRVLEGGCVLAAVSKVISRETGATTLVSDVRFTFKPDLSQVVGYWQANRLGLEATAAAAKKLMTAWEKADEQSWRAVVSDDLTMVIEDPKAGTFSFSSANDCWKLRETRPPE